MNVQTTDPPRAPRIGALFAGYSGLEMGVQSVLGGSTAWVSEIDPGACRILAHRLPGVPNLGDIERVGLNYSDDEWSFMKNADTLWRDTGGEIGEPLPRPDWSTVPPVDVLTGGFPCFPAGTLITTSVGLVPIEDVRVSDLVMTHERRWRPVVQTMSRTADHSVTVKAMGAPRITTTDEHPFYVKRARSASPEWVKAADLLPGMYLAQPLDTPSRQELSTSELAEWYLIGRWIGDGWTIEHRRTSTTPQGQRGSRVDSMARRIHWCCASDETDRLEKAFAAAGLAPTKVEERTVVKYVMQSATWADRLAAFGRYAHGKHLPEYVHQLPAAAQVALLQGWLDSDGDVKRDGTINGTTTSKALAVGMGRIARAVHGKAVSIHDVIPPPTTRIEGRTVNQRPFWNVRISPGPSKVAFVADGFAWVPVRSVKRADIAQDVYNIGVQDDESYVAEGVVVHNCQDVSHAGARKGLGPGTRSGLWSRMADAIDHLRPSLVIAENVRGLLSAEAASDVEPCPWCLGDGPGEPPLRALGAVLADLAELGYDASWYGLRAADVGAPHGRFRVFVLAWPAGGTPAYAAGAVGWGRREHRPHSGRAAAERHWRAELGDGGRCSPADASRHGRDEGRPEPAGELRGSDASLSGHAPADADSASGEACGGRPGTGHAGRLQSVVGSGPTWGPYEPAIRRWERRLGRPAPAPTEPGSKGQPRLSPAFVEFMMGLPVGWVTDVPGLSRNDQLKALGNGVVPQQAAAAVRFMLARLAEESRWAA